MGSWKVRVHRDYIVPIMYQPQSADVTVCAYMYALDSHLGEFVLLHMLLL